MADDDFKYTGVHAFVFMNDVHPALDVAAQEPEGSGVGDHDDP
jgi:hypothetical protein